MEGFIELRAAIQTSIRSVGSIFAVVEKSAPASEGVAIIDETSLTGTRSWWLRWIIIACWERACSTRIGSG